MAIVKICAIRDRQLDAYLVPFAMQSLGQAIRAFRDDTNNPESALHKHPEDYELYHVADFDQETGVAESYGEKGCPEHGGHSLPRQIAIASNLIERTK